LSLSVPVLTSASKKKLISIEKNDQLVFIFVPMEKVPAQSLPQWVVIQKTFYSHTKYRVALL
jgi:hypothetical protein